MSDNSVSCGIPDFRSKDGVYDLVPRLDLGLGCAEDLFDLEFFVHDPEPFFKFAKVCRRRPVQAVGGAVGLLAGCVYIFSCDETEPPEASVELWLS